MFQHLLSERLTSLGIMGAHEVPSLCREMSVSRTANVGTVGMNWLRGATVAAVAGLESIGNISSNKHHKLFIYSKIVFFYYIFVTGLKLRLEESNLTRILFIKHLRELAPLGIICRPPLNRWVLYWCDFGGVLLLFIWALQLQMPKVTTLSDSLTSGSWRISSCGGIRNILLSYVISRNPYGELNNDPQCIKYCFICEYLSLHGIAY